MRPIMVLVCHNHDTSVSQLFSVLIIFAKLQSNNFYNVLNFLILHDWLVRRFSHIQQFAL